ncbi:MAG TPA: trehalase family glycosidase, partial [Candidatus Hydrogenedentes bacterium]|nr:trehalase family glycosidase [Candidatus Hydrogenedentota bacterium]
VNREGERIASTTRKGTVATAVIPASQLAGGGRGPNRNPAFSVLTEPVKLPEARPWAKRNVRVTAVENHVGIDDLLQKLDRAGEIGSDLVCTYEFVWISGPNKTPQDSERVAKQTAAAQENLRIQDIRGRIIHLDEVLTMSARMYVLTGDPSWQARYERFVPKLDDAIKEVLTHAIGIQTSTQTDKANEMLVQMEHRSFELTRADKPSEAKAILLGEEYATQKAIYSAGMDQLGRRLDEAADEAMRALFVKQRPDGKLLLAVQPGQPNREEEDTQPPIVAWSLCHQNERNGRTECLQELYPAVVRYLEWFEHNRKNGHGLYGWRVRVDADPVRGARGGESGMDNSPRFDRIAGMTAVDLSCYMASEYRCMGKLAQCLGRTEDVAEWRRRHIEIARRVNALLWDDEDQFYYDLDEQDDFVPVKTTAGFMPLLAEIPDRDRAEALRMHLTNPKEFWSAAPLASVSQDERDFCQDMWRGPMWPNVNLLVYYGLMAYGFFQEARALGRATLREISHWYARTGCFYEYYDSTGTLPPPELPRKGGVGEQGGVGFGVVADLHWTAAVYVHLSNELG